MTTRATVAFVFATPQEAAPLLSKLLVREIAYFPYATFASTTAGGKEFIIMICGMGLSAAATGTEYLINHFRPRKVINCGIAGSLSSARDIGEILQIAAVTNTDSIETAVDLKRLDFIQIAHDFSFCQGGPPQVKLASQTAPVFDIGRRAMLATVAELIDMEGFAIAETCERHAMPYGLLKVVSDHADDRDTLLKNMAHTSRRLADFIDYFLEPLIYSELPHEPQSSLSAP